MNFRNWVRRISVGASLCLVLASTHAAPEADLWPMWQASASQTSQSVNHTPWQQFLDHYLVTDPSGITLVRYSQVTEPDALTLQRYIEGLTALDPRTLVRAEQFAYWVNLYNALTVNLILEHYPTQSITKIRSSWFSFGPWNKAVANIAGQDITLNDIEHRILRPIWRDPRIHFAVNCASIGCPNLSATAFTADNSEALLEQATQAFLAHPRAVAIETSTVRLSSIFDWYQNDFGDSELAVRAYIGQKLDGDTAEAVLDPGRSLSFDYDWALNDAKRLE